MSDSDTSRQQLTLLRVIGFSGLATVVAAAVAVSQYQERNQLNIEYLKSQLQAVQQQLADISKQSEQMSVIRYQTDDNAKRIARLEESNAD